MQRQISSKTRDRYQTDIRMFLEVGHDSFVICIPKHAATRLLSPTLGSDGVESGLTAGGFKLVDCALDA